MKLRKIAFSLFFLTSFLAQLTVSLYHSLADDHSVEICSSNDINHICDHNSKQLQNFYKLNLDYNTFFEYQFINKTQINSVDILKNDLLINHQQLSFSLRGPPSLFLI